MKKLIILLFIILQTVFFPVKSTAFLPFSDNDWFYTNIAKNINTLENNIFSIDLIWENWTKERINQILGSECLISDLSEDEIISTVYNWNLTIIINKISPNCKWENWEIIIEQITRLNQAVITLYNETRENSEEKTRKTLVLWWAWIFTDWVEENSPFDLVTDILNIDSIIFMEESTVYEWNEFFDLWNKINDLLKWVNQVNKNINSSSNLNIPINNQNRINSNNWWNIPFYLNSINSLEIYSQNVCNIDNSNSWLNIDSLENLVNSVWDTIIDWVVVNSWNNNNNNSLSGNTNIIDNIKAKSSNYSKVTDNSVFPCDSIFCIDIQFITYTHNLLWWWFQNPTIEYLLNRSNEHLKKFASTSLVQSKMSLNNFELWLKDLNLPDIFHLWFQITTKPVPILEIEPEWKEENDIFSRENQMKLYYELNWLDYYRRNDLSKIRWTEINKQIWLNSSMWRNVDFSNLVSDYWIKLENDAIERNIITKALENNTRIDWLAGFERQFKELEVFNESINDYVRNLDALVKNIRDIPQDIWQN